MCSQGNMLLSIALDKKQRPREVLNGYLPYNFHLIQLQESNKMRPRRGLAPNRGRLQG